MPANKRNISFATFNLYNLQLPDQPMYPKSRPYTQEQYDAKIGWIASMIKRLDADVIAFQELWDRQALETAFEAAGLSESYSFAYIMEGAWDGIAVAAAVRKPWEITGVKRHKAFPQGLRLKKRERTMKGLRADPPEADEDIVPDENDEFGPSHEDERIEVSINEFSRSPLQVTVTHGTAKSPSVPPIQVFCTHLKSKLSTPLDNEEYRNPAIRPHTNALGAALSAIRRTAEAAALRIILNDTMRDTDDPTIVLGDINDGQFSNVVSILSGQPTFRVIAASRSGGRSDVGLYTGVTLQQLRSLGDVYYTHEFKNVREVIDHALVSEQFYDHSEKRLWAFREMQFFNDHVAHASHAESDHGQVRIWFQWAPAG
ncbi:endonuclease/exonuclease/phosphatase family protein [Rhodopseudomonas sp. NSM]|uniref:endonuclease/exonuclease/phosphatase family protein n=1 Tax=Rhodopseudomonas sp. NSM TaxID=3457630 RepID=UPI0040375AC2